MQNPSQPDPNSEHDAKVLCDKVKSTLLRNQILNVDCQPTDKGMVLTGTAKSQSDKAIAFALARTTIGAGKLSNQIRVVDQLANESGTPDQT